MKIYTREDIEFLKEFYPKFGVKYCANVLGRTAGAIASRCSMLKIKLNPETLSVINKAAQETYQANRSNDDFNVNVEQFLNIETPYVAYFLGFLWADGYIVRQEIRLDILKTDMDVIKDSLNKLGKWNFYERTRGNNKPICTASTNNRRLYDFLVDNDFKVKSGSSADKILERIPSNLKHYFFRGLIDGDGHIRNKGITIGSCYQQDWGFITSLNERLGVTSCIYRIRRDKSKSSSLDINGIHALNFCKYIYQGVEQDKIGLTRKYNSFLKLKSFIEGGRNFIANKKKELALDMHRSGKTIPQIIKELDIASTTVRRYLKESVYYEEIQNRLKISDKDVIQIRSNLKQDMNMDETYKLFSDRLSLRIFAKICSGQTWKHLL